MGSAMATQMSWSGLGSEADAREEAKAMRATVTKKLTPFFIIARVLSLMIFTILSIVVGSDEKFCIEKISIYRHGVLELVFYLTI